MSRGVKRRSLGARINRQQAEERAVYRDGAVIGHHREDERGRAFIEYTEEERDRRAAALVLEPEDYINPFAPGFDEPCDSEGKPLTGWTLVDYYRETLPAESGVMFGAFPIMTEQQARDYKQSELERERIRDELWAGWKPRHQR